MMNMKRFLLLGIWVHDHKLDSIDTILQTKRKKDQTLMLIQTMILLILTLLMTKNTMS